MRIGIDVSRANSEEKTGVERYAYSLIQSLKRLEKQDPRLKNLEFVLYTDKPLQGELAELPGNWTQKVLEWPPKRLWTQVRLSSEMLFHAPDILFVPAHVCPIIHPRKTVMTVHDVAALKFPQSYNRFERWYSVWSARTALKKMWKVIVPSEFTKRELTSAFGPPSNSAGGQSSDKIQVVYHGYDEKYRKIDDEKNIEKILNKYSIQKPFILSVGRLEEKKNTVRIIKAFERTKINLQSSIFSLQLVLVGKPGYGYEKVKQQIDDSEFKNDIITPGWVGEEDIPYLLNAAAVFVFPSLYEGFGLPVLEAMACGTPVVMSKGLSLEEIGGEAGVYIDPLDVDDMAYRISQLITGSEQRTSYVERGLLRVKDFSWEKCAKETLDILLSEV